MKFVEGMKKIWADPLLKGTLILGMGIMVYLDVMMGLGLVDGSFQGVSAFLIAYPFLVVVVLFFLTLTAGDIDEWKPRKLVLVLLLVAPLFILVLPLLAVAVLPAFVLQYGISASFSHLLCLRAGKRVQDFVESRGAGERKKALMLVPFVLVALVPFVLVLAVPTPEEFDDVWAMFTIGAIVLVFGAVGAMVIGFARKRIPLAIGPYFLAASMYFIYLFVRIVLVVLGFTTGEVTLITLPYTAFILFYAMGNLVGYLLPTTDFKERPRARAAVIFLLFVQLLVHLVIILVNVEESSVMGVASGELLEARASFYGFFFLLVAFTLYILWTSSGRRGTPPSEEG
ncbi:MAG: hypothetical protein ACTSU5_02280 [Promethearchaeota archaeon]